MRTPGFIKLFLIILFLLICTVSIFIRPGNLDQSDFMLIAWNPGQQLLKSGSVDANYPYPLWTVVVMLPLVIWSSETAMLLMFFCNMVMLAASLALFVLVFEWKLTPLMLGLTVSLAAFFLPVLTSLWLGQLTIFSLLILALTVYFYMQQRWVWLGVVVGLSFIKPQVMLLLAGLILSWAVWQRHWRVLLGFFSVIFVLVVISLPFISSPTQLIGGGVGTHLENYILKTSTLWGILMSLKVNWLIPLFISLALLFWLGLQWLPFIKGTGTNVYRVFYLFSIAVMINLIIVPYSWMHNLALLLLPIGYSLTLLITMKSYARIFYLFLLVFIMHPLMVGLFIVFTGESDTQAYQIIPALILLPMMVFLEKHSSLMDA